MSLPHSTTRLDTPSSPLILIFSAVARSPVCCLVYSMSVMSPSSLPDTARFEAPIPDACPSPSPCISGSLLTSIVMDSMDGISRRGSATGSMSVPDPTWIASEPSLSSLMYAFDILM